MRDVGAPRLDERPDLVALLGVEQPQPGAQALPTAASQPARLKMNVIAGSSPSASSRSMHVDPARRRRPGRGRRPPRRGRAVTDPDAPRPARGRAAPARG